MEWSRLISDKRLGLEDFHDSRKNTIRSDFRRDYDRLAFSAPFRRLQNKTQVFPLPGSIIVHNRLTHSIEVSCVGRSLAEEIATELRRKYITEPWVDDFTHIGDIVAAACLAHDLGNPPFGHSGEKAISTFFSEGAGRKLQDMLAPEEWDDLIHFEGNANAFRVLAHQFKGRRRGGFAMTYSMLASIVKYPFESTLARGNKFGFFTSEREDFKRIADELCMIPLPDDAGRMRYARHPLVFIVEAADDICYEVMDIEDAHKLRLIDTREVMQRFLAFFDEKDQEHMRSVCDYVDDPNEKVAYLRSCVVGKLVECCTEAFVRHEEEILRGQFHGSLLSAIPPRQYWAYQKCIALSWNKIYRSGHVVDIELAGNRIITFLLEKLIHAVMHPDLNYSRLLLAKFPEQYDVAAPTLYGRIQAVLDHISAMTDVYALDLYRKLCGITVNQS